MKYTKIENGKRVWDASKTYGLFEKQAKFYASGISATQVTKAHRKNLESLSGVLKFILTDELGFELIIADSQHQKYHLPDTQGGGVNLYIWFESAEITVGDFSGHTSSYITMIHFDEFFDLIRRVWNVRIKKWSVE